MEDDEDVGFLCPISLSLMIDPVLTCDGWTFERSLIESWLKDHDTSPLTNMVLENKNLVPNRALKDAISAKVERSRFHEKGRAWQIPGHRVEISAEELGRGALGVVVSAVLVEGGRRVPIAAKSLPGLLPEQERTMLQKEVDRLCWLTQRCTRVCRLIGTCFKEGRMHILMKRYQGSLQDELLQCEGRRFGLERAIKVMREVAAATAEIHELNIVVADLKPGNILYDIFGEHVVTDFGISGFIQGTMSRFMPSSVQGTCNYMAPEQFDPEEFGGLTCKTDAWGLGCILFELLMGEPPWNGKQFQEAHPQPPQVIYGNVVHKKMTPMPPDGALPHLVVNLLERCFRYRQQERCSASEVFDTLCELAACHPPPPTAPPGLSAPEQLSDSIIAALGEEDAPSAPPEHHGHAAGSGSSAAAPTSSSMRRDVSFVLSGNLVSREGLSVDERLLETLVSECIRQGDAAALDYLTSIEYVAAKAFVGGVHALLQELADADALARQLGKAEVVEGVRRFVGKHLSVLREPPTPSAVFQLALQEPDDSSVCVSAGRYALQFAAVKWCNKPQSLDPCVMMLEGLPLATAVAYSPNGKLMASGAGVNAVVLNRVTGEKMFTLKGHSYFVKCIAFSPDGKCIASGDDETVHIWDVVTMEKVCSLKHSKKMTCVTYSPDGKHIASAHEDQTVKFWDCETMQEVCNLRESGSVLSFAYSRDSRSLASVSVDGTAKLWDLSGDTPVEKGTLKGHADRVRCVAYSPDGKRMASASDDKAVKIWDAVTMEEVGILRGHSRDNPECTCRHYQESGNWRVDFNAECPVKGHSRGVTRVAWSPDGRNIVSACYSTVKIWDADTKLEVCTLNPDHIGDFHYGYREQSVTCIAYSPDSKHIASAAFGGTVKIWDADAKQEVCSMEKYPDFSGCFACSPDGRHIALDFRGNNVKVWDTETKQEVCSRKLCTTHVMCVAYSPDGKYIATCTADYCGSIDVSDAVTMEVAWSIRAEQRGGHCDMLRCVAWSLDSEFIASSDNNKTVCVWSKSGELKATLKGHCFQNPKCTCRHYKIVNGKIWAMEANAECPVNGHSGLVYSVAWSPDGEMIVTGSCDKTVRLWSKLGEHKGALKGHQDAVTSVAYSTDGKQIASASNDQTVKIWDSETRQQVCSLRGHVASWQGLEPKTKELAAKVEQGWSSGSKGTDKYIVTAHGDMVYVYKIDLNGKEHGEALACFRSPAGVRAVSCRGTKVVVCCHNGQVLFLEAPLLAAGWILGEG